MKALIISGDIQVTKDIDFCLRVRYDGISVKMVENGLKGLEFLNSEVPDLIVIDYYLKDFPVIEIVKKIRDISDVGIIFLAEGQSELVRAKLLEAGADDYIFKPFSPLELLAKVKALLRRSQSLGFKPREIVSLGKCLSINLATGEVFSFGKAVSLTPTEYKLLLELVRNQGMVLTNDILLEKIWGSEYLNDYSFVKKYVYRLRSKIEPDADSPKIILNERGIGYKIASHI